MTQPSQSDPIRATAWLYEETPLLEGDGVQIQAELSDVDEIALMVHDAEGQEVIAVHLDRVHAIALAGELAKAATTTQTTLPHGHAEDM